MRKWTLSVLALTMVGVVAVEAQAGGGRRGRAYRPMASSSPVNSSLDRPNNDPSSSEATSSVKSASWDSPTTYSSSPTVYYSSSRCVGGS